MNGQFEIVSGKVRVSDPCYDLDTWCGHTLEGVKKGTWNCFVENNETEGRVAVLEARHAESTSRLLPIIYLPQDEVDIGVDSGQAGIFDLQHFKDDTVVPSNFRGEMYGDEGEKGAKWYSLCCYQTLDTDGRSGVIPFGCVSSSGYGDGGYPLAVAKDSNGEIVGIRIVFIDNSQEDEDDDNELDDECHACGEILGDCICEETEEES